MTVGVIIRLFLHGISDTEYIYILFALLQQYRRRGRAQEDLTPSSLEGRAHEVGGPGPLGRGHDEVYLSAYHVRKPYMDIKLVRKNSLRTYLSDSVICNGVKNGVFLHRFLHRHVVRQVAQYGGRGQPTASGSGRCLPETSSRGSEDAGNGRRAERRSGVSSAVLRYLTTNDIVTSK